MSFTAAPSLAAVADWTVKTDKLGEGGPSPPLDAPAGWLW